jgi:hypothetical protein
VHRFRQTKIPACPHIGVVRTNNLALCSPLLKASEIFARLQIDAPTNADNTARVAANSATGIDSPNTGGALAPGDQIGAFHAL